MISPVSDRPFYWDSTTTEAFKALASRPPLEFAQGGAKAVVIGGGTGAPVTIQTLITLGFQTDAVVAMADDGGSTGLIRELTDATPPGDVRKCLAAFAKDADDPLTKAFQARFGFADGHALGNLLISALEEITGSFPDAIARCETLLQARGHVLPSTLAHVTLRAETVSGAAIEGQSKASKAAERLHCVRLEAAGPIPAYEPAVRAIREADLIALGPGSLFTSIIPNLCVDGIREALAQAKAPIVFVCPIADMQGETRGMRIADMVEALRAHGLQGRIGYCIANLPASIAEGFEARPPEESAVAWAAASPAGMPLVEIDAGERDALAVAGTDLVLMPLSNEESPTWHKPAALADALTEVARRCRLVQR